MIPRMAGTPQNRSPTRLQISEAVAKPEVPCGVGGRGGG
jgi:hypothetical protein